MKTRLVDLLRCPTCAGQLELNVLQVRSRDRSGRRRGADRGGSAPLRRLPRLVPDLPARPGAARLLDRPPHGVRLGASSGCQRLPASRRPCSAWRASDRSRASARSGSPFKTTSSRSPTRTGTARTSSGSSSVGATTRRLPAESCSTSAAGTEPRRACCSSVTGMEVFGTDLNLSLLASGPTLDREPLVHTVIASLFALPFPHREFDVVYSHGVLHHTFSTSAAFASIADYVAPGGTLSIWVYAKSDFEGSRRLRLSAGTERLFRPLVAGAPKRLQSAVTHALSVTAFCSLPASRHESGAVAVQELPPLDAGSLDPALRAPARARRGRGMVSRSGLRACRRRRGLLRATLRDPAHRDRAAGLTPCGRGLIVPAPRRPARRAHRALRQMRRSCGPASPRCPEHARPGRGSPTRRRRRERGGCPRS